MLKMAIFILWTETKLMAYISCQLHKDLKKQNCPTPKNSSLDILPPAFPELGFISIRLKDNIVFFSVHKLFSKQGKLPVIQQPLHPCCLFVSRLRRCGCWCIKPTEVTPVAPDLIRINNSHTLLIRLIKTN